MLNAPPPPLDPEFVADCPYGPEGLLIDQILLVDQERQLVRARMPTSDDLPLTRAQRAHPVRHPRHVSGGLMVHMTGMMGFAHAYYLLGLRHADGWIGYGAKINSARFRALAPPGAPLVLECRATQIRRGDTSVFARYLFTFTQEETIVYEGDQVAYFTNVNAKMSAKAAMAVEAGAE
jgi:3-hydroxymyristoyl/3-hydroxydecanoyl-(acyl carrier protein) dehydratase